MTGTGTGAPELDGAPLFLLDSLPQTEELLVDGAEGRHAVEVLRLAPGERVRVGDGQGTVAEGNVLAADAAGLRVAVLARYEVPAPAPEFVLVQALPKGDHGPLAVDLATELGVDRIVPWTAARCVTRWRDDRVAKGMAKWHGEGGGGRAGGQQAVAPSPRPRGPRADDHAAGVRAAGRRRPRRRAARAGPPSTGRADRAGRGNRGSGRRPRGRAHRRRGARLPGCRCACGPAGFRGPADVDRGRRCARRTLAAHALDLTGRFR